jgi:hypothetical protein
VSLCGGSGNIPLHGKLNPVNIEFLLNNFKKSFCTSQETYYISAKKDKVFNAVVELRDFYIKAGGKCTTNRL